MSDEPSSGCSPLTHALLPCRTTEGVRKGVDVSKVVPSKRLVSSSKINFLGKGLRCYKNMSSGISHV